MSERITLFYYAFILFPAFITQGTDNGSKNEEGRNKVQELSLDKYVNTIFLNIQNQMPVNREVEDPALFYDFRDNDRLSVWWKACSCFPEHVLTKSIHNDKQHEFKSSFSFLSPVDF